MYLSAMSIDIGIDNLINNFQKLYADFAYSFLGVKDYNNCSLLR